MGESQQEQVSLRFDARVRLESVGSRITIGFIGIPRPEGRVPVARMAYLHARGAAVQPM